MKPQSSPFRFAARVLLFCAPFLLILFLCEALFWRAGETWPVARVIQYQELHPDAWFLRGKFDQQMSRYKYLGLKKAKPRILALGSSRVMKFRSEMFGEGRGGFYNGTGLIDQITTVSDFVDLFRGDLPRVIIFGIDPWLLNDQRQSTRRLADELSPDAAFDWRAHLAILRHLKGRDVRRLWDAVTKHSPNRIGAAATLLNQGYRWDGSFATQLPVSGTNWIYRDRETPPIPERIRKGAGLFQSTEHLSQTYLNTLARNLREMKRQGVTVIGFLPPLSSEANELLSTLPEQQQFWSEYKAQTAELFRALDMPFTDATDLRSLGLDDRYMTDGIHAEETFHLHLLRRMLKDPRVASALPLANKTVEAALADPGTNPYYPVLEHARTQ